MPMIYELEFQAFRDTNLNFAVLQNLDSIGLISHYTIGSVLYDFGKDTRLRVDYHSTVFIVDLPKKESAVFKRGCVMFTSLGEQLARLCSPQPYDGFEDYLVSKWKELGYKVTIYRSNEAPQEA